MGRRAGEVDRRAGEVDRRTGRVGAHAVVRRVGVGPGRPSLDALATVAEEIAGVAVRLPGVRGCAVALLGPEGPPWRLACLGLAADEQRRVADAWAQRGCAEAQPGSVDLVLGGTTARAHIALYPRRAAAPLDLLRRYASLAIENAWLRQQEQLRAPLLQRLKQQVVAQQAKLERSREIHDRLVRSILDARGIGGVGMALADLVTSPVVIEDKHFNLLSASVPADGTITTGRFPEWTTPKAFLALPDVRQLLRRLSRERRAVVIPAYPEIGIRAPSIIAPVVLRDEVLAYVSIYRSEREFEDLDFMACEQAAIVVALELMRQRTVQEAEARLRGDFLDDLVGGLCGDEEALIQRAIFLGYDISVPSYLLVVKPDEEPDEPAGQARTPLPLDRGLAGAVADALRSWSRQSLVSMKSGQVVAVVPAAPSADGAAPRVAELAARVQSRCQAALRGRSVSVGVGRPCRSPRDYADAYATARNCLALTSRLGRRGRVVAFEELGVERVLLGLRDPGSVREFVEMTVGPLLRYDAGHGTQLVATLRAYLEHNLSLRQTAAACVIHLSTLRYRLRRIQEIARVDLQSSDDRLNLQMALRVNDTLMGRPGV